MWSGKRISLSREGMYYLGVVLFIIGGAVLRERNLLIVLAGMMIGPLIFNWRFVAHSLRRLRIERHVPPRTSAGVPVSIEVVAENQRGRLSTWALQVQDVITLKTATDEPPTPTEILFSRVAPGETASRTYSCTLTRRGRYLFGPLTTATRFPLGLIRASVVSRAPSELIVSPRIGRLSPLWHQMLDGAAHGSQHTDRRRGFTEGDYYGLREWQVGDSRRWIHWRTSARLGNLAVKQFERRRSRDVTLLVDLVRADAESELQEESGLVPIEWALSMAATAVMELCQRSDSRITVGLAAARCTAWVSRPASRILAEEVLDALAVAEPAVDGLDALFREIGEAVRPDTKVVVISTRRRPDVLPEDPRGSIHPGTFHWIDASDPSSSRYYNVS